MSGFSAAGRVGDFGFGLQGFGGIIMAVGGGCLERFLHGADLKHPPPNWPTWGVYTSSVAGLTGISRDAQMFNSYPCFSRGPGSCTKVTPGILSRELSIMQAAFLRVRAIGIQPSGFCPRPPRPNLKGMELLQKISGPPCSWHSLRC